MEDLSLCEHIHVEVQVHVNVAGRFTFDSDARLKRDGKNLGYGLREALQLRPVSCGGITVQMRNSISG